jgi:DNA-binding Lrp family transcriptional regulator
MSQQLTERQRKVLSELQGDLPEGLQPYDVLAVRAGMPVDEFLAVSRELLASGYVRKVAALVNHRRAGFVANAMCVWQVPPDRVEEAGRTIASFDEVTHCYQRPVGEAWPYALFAMVHARTREECEQVARRIADAVEPTSYRILYSTRELKKRSLRLPL